MQTAFIIIFIYVLFLPPSESVGMVMVWEQATGLLYASGDVRYIRLWDTHKELKIQVS